MQSNKKENFKNNEIVVCTLTCRTCRTCSDIKEGDLARLRKDDDTIHYDDNECTCGYYRKITTEDIITKIEQYKYLLKEDR